MEILMSFQLPANPLAYTGSSFAAIGKLPFFGKLPIEAYAIPSIG